MEPSELRPPRGARGAREPRPLLGLREGAAEREEREPRGLEGGLRGAGAVTAGGGGGASSSSTSISTSSSTSSSGSCSAPGIKAEEEEDLEEEELEEAAGEVEDFMPNSSPSSASRSRGSSTARDEALAFVVVEAFVGEVDEKEEEAEEEEEGMKELEEELEVEEALVGEMADGGGEVLANTYTNNTQPTVHFMSIFASPFPFSLFLLSHSFLLHFSFLPTNLLSEEG